jgi:hypothetical protein
VSLNSLIKSAVTAEAQQTVCQSLRDAVEKAKIAA